MIKLANHIHAPDRYPGHNYATLAEFVVALSNLKTLEDKVKFTQEFTQSEGRRRAVDQMIVSLFHPAVRFNLPQGAPEYRVGLRHQDRMPANLISWISKKLTYFVVGNVDEIKNIIRGQKYFLGVLEAMTEGDSVLLLSIKEKDWVGLGMTPEYAMAICSKYLPEIPVAMVTEGNVEAVPEKRRPGRPKKVPSAV